MCGIVGLFLKNPALQPELGRHLQTMLIGMTERGPDSAGRTTFEILAQRHTPLRQSTIIGATVSPDTPPYGSKLVIDVPPIPTLRYEPDASFSSLSLTIGGTAGAREPIVIPRRCPPGGFPFAASFSFADHSSASESGRLPCP